MRAENINISNSIKMPDICTSTKSVGYGVDCNAHPYQERLSVNNIPSSQIAANYLPLSFKGNAPAIKRAYVITSENEDMPLMATKQNDSYIIDFDSQTEIIYGVDAIKYLYNHDSFEYDTQVIFPKKAKGVLHIDGKDIELNENTAVMLNEGTKAKIDVKSGYPMMIMSKKDYDWYERYGRDAQDNNIRNKFLELMYYNSHLYNGEFTPNTLLSDKLRDENFLRTISIDKWQSGNNLLYDLYSKREQLNEYDRKLVEKAKSIMDKLFAMDMLVQKNDGYLKFKHPYTAEYVKFILKDFGFEEDEINMVTPIITQARQVHMDSKFSIRNPKSKYNPKLVKKMQDVGILYTPQKETEFIYWKECYGNEDSLRKVLCEKGFTYDEQAEIIRSWRENNTTGFDVSGLKFINENAAVYDLNTKLNNWTHEKTPWVTNSTALSSSKSKTPFIGVSIVQAADKRPIRMSELRKEEKLHSHPNLAEKRQTEVYLITSGAAALNVVKNGKSSVKILEEGDLAVVDAGVLHCVNSILGEYEQIVAQVPSAFQYGFGFKVTAQPPEDYDERQLELIAHNKLKNIQKSNFIY